MQIFKVEKNRAKAEVATLMQIFKVEKNRGKQRKFSLCHWSSTEFAIQALGSEDIPVEDCTHPEYINSETSTFGFAYHTFCLGILWDSEFSAKIFLLRLLCRTFREPLRVC